MKQDSELVQTMAAVTVLVIALLFVSFLFLPEQ